MEGLINIALLIFLMITAYEIVRLRSLYAVVMLSGIFGLLSASIFVVLDAVDVAFTEASVGAGVTPMLMLATLSLTSRDEAEHAPGRVLVPMLICIVTGAALIYGTMDMPMWGDANAAVNQFMAPHFINHSEAEIGLPNIVTSVLASYRGYDTMGETCVVFTAAIGVLAILGRVKKPILKKLPKLIPQTDQATHSLKDHSIMRALTKLMIPFILVFSLYVQFHGDFGPGGGFQAGVIFASAFILYALIFGIGHGRWVVPMGLLRVSLGVGVLLYAGVGVYSLFNGSNFLNYAALAHDPIHGQHLGILLVEFGVGVTVAAAMITIFFTFIGHNPRK
ncbi:MAG: DUF4040 domain-containing protein [Magnetococcales bacterium]|nr:DUF4040 domain-containing protein [Magnetococcales bacterium]